MFKTNDCVLNTPMNHTVIIVPPTYHNIFTDFRSTYLLFLYISNTSLYEDGGNVVNNKNNSTTTNSDPIDE